ncbi:hypothetical protein CJ178_31455 [Rhodococcus sp. ACPA4]|nr:hypothetical protein CJ178_31455 [Rhodococcus sp. ACPA4]
MADMRRFGDVVSFRAELYEFGVSIGDDAVGREAAAGGRWQSKDLAAKSYPNICSSPVRQHLNTARTT